MAKTILAVDDSPTIRKAIELTFEATDYRVEAVGSEPEALDRLQSGAHAAVLVDAGLGDGAGYRLAGTIKSRDPSLPVVLLTSQTHAYDPGRGQQAGVGTFIDKPFQTQSLIDLVARETEAPAAAGRAVAQTQPEAFPEPTYEPAPELELDVEAPAEIGFAGSDDLEEIEEIDIEDVPDEPVSPELRPDEAFGAAPPTPGPPPAVEPTPRSVDLAAAVGAPATDAVVARASEAEPVLRELPADELRRIAREVIERVAWEVVPDLAEAIIREELRRLTSE
jgi:CheY-like chemotaxis protein